VLPQAAFTAACDLFDGIAKAAGLVAVGTEAKGGRGRPGVVCDLTNDMVFESERGAYALDELEDGQFAAGHEGHDCVCRRRSSDTGRIHRNASSATRSDIAASTCTISRPA
jgi:hypothetical protein